MNDRPTLIDRLRSYLTADTDESEVYNGDQCPNCRATLSVTQVKDKSGVVSKNKHCSFCGWRPGREPDRTPAEARQTAKDRAERADRMFKEMRDDDQR